MATASINRWINWKARKCDGTYTLRQYVKLCNPSFGDCPVGKFEIAFMNVKKSTWCPRNWTAEQWAKYNSGTVKP